jgi:Methane oxygenase PmoA
MSPTRPVLDAAPATVSDARATVPALAVTHDVGSGLSVCAAGVELLRYNYRSGIPAFECPAPYFHPLRDLAGEVVTGHRPHDHRWHKGLTMTASHLSGGNFWGGGTYTPGAPGDGYVELPNVGSLQHLGFEEFTMSGDRVRVVERVDWISAEQQRWIDERRTFVVGDVDIRSASWSLEFATELTNVRAEVLEFGSPSVFGRELAGYCGLFWRGPREFVGGTVLGAGGKSGPELMGQRSDWMAFVGRHDGSDGASTLLFDQDPDNADAPAHWFVRTEPIPVVNPSLAFYRGVQLAAGETLRRRYRVVVAAQAWDSARVESYLEAHPLLTSA